MRPNQMKVAKSKIHHCPGDGTYIEAILGLYEYDVGAVDSCRSGKHVLIFMKNESYKAPLKIQRAASQHVLGTRRLQPSGL